MRPLLALLLIGSLSAAEPVGLATSDTLGAVLVDWMPKRYAVEIESDSRGTAEAWGRWEFSVDQRIPLIFVSDLSNGLTGGFYASLDTGLAVDGDISRFRLGWSMGGMGMAKLGDEARFMVLLGVGTALETIDLPPNLRVVADHQRGVLFTSHIELIGVLMLGDPESLSAGIFGGFTANYGNSQWYANENLSLTTREWGPMMGVTLARKW